MPLDMYLLTNGYITVGTVKDRSGEEKVAFRKFNDSRLYIFLNKVGDEINLLEADELSFEGKMGKYELTEDFNKIESELLRLEFNEFVI